MVGGARRRRFTRYRCRTGGPRRRVPPWIIQQNFFSECRFHGALPITLHDMIFEMPAGLDQLFIPPNDDILLPDGVLRGGDRLYVHAERQIQQRNQPQGPSSKPTNAETTLRNWIECMRDRLL